jgi:group I intron endonuclease
MASIYQIKNLTNSKVYVGSAVDLKRRWSVHRANLCAGTHHCTPLQNAWTKNGESAFLFQLIELCESTEMLEREQFWIDKTKCYSRQYGYNLLRTAGSHLGSKRSEATRQRMAASARERNARPEYKSMLRQRAVKQHAEGSFNLTPESRRKAALRNRGRVKSEAERQKLRAVDVEKRKAAARASVLARGYKLKG